MTRTMVLVWWVAMLLAVIVAVCREERRSVDVMSIGVLVEEATEDHPPTLATLIEALEVGIGYLRRDVLVAADARRIESTERPRVRATHRTARGPPQARRATTCTNERAPDRKEKTC